MVTTNEQVFSSLIEKLAAFHEGLDGEEAEAYATLVATPPPAGDTAEDVQGLDFTFVPMPLNCQWVWQSKLKRCLYCNGLLIKCEEYQA